MKTLTTIQSESVAEILSLPTNGRRAAGFGLTVLNRRSICLGRVRRSYERQAAKFGFRPDQISAQWRDVLDVAILEDATAR